MSSFHIRKPDDPGSCPKHSEKLPTPNFFSNTANACSFFADPGSITRAFTGTGPRPTIAANEELYRRGMSAS